MSGNRLPVATSEKSTRPASKSSRLMLIASPSVIVHDLHIPRRSLAPFKAYPPAASQSFSVQFPIERPSQNCHEVKTWMAGTFSAKTRFALLPGHDELD